MKLRFDARAICDLREIHAYLIEKAEVGAADSVRTHLRVRTRQLAKRPLIGLATTMSEIRVLPPTRYPYRIYYTIQGEDLVILHIRHTSRRAPEADELT